MDIEKEDPYTSPSLAKAEDSASYLKPIIEELVRTQVCFPNIKLLVDRISIVKVPSATDSSSHEAYLMYLTDREKTIQAVVQRRLYKWLTTFDVREGSYVILKEYHLATGKRLRGDGEVFYLAISDFYPIGEEQRYSTDIELEDISASAEGSSADSLDQESARDESGGNEVGTMRAERSLPGAIHAQVYNEIDSSEHSSSSESTFVDPKKRRRGTSSTDLEPHLLSTVGKTDRIGETPRTKTLRGQGQKAAQSKLSDDHIIDASTSKIPSEGDIFTRAQVSPEQPPSPLRLSTLASITGTNASRNKQVNILAMIDYVSSSTVKPTTAPLKRDVRIVDPSIDKKVTLSVFIDPVNFIPKEYDIILFRDLTTHDFSGGNLNAYPKKCRGKEWYIVNPYDIKECDMKSMEEFRARYRKMKVREFR